MRDSTWAEKRMNYRLCVGQRRRPTLYHEPLGRLDIELLLAGKEIQSTQCTLLRDPLNPASNRIDAQVTYALDSDRFQFQANGKDLHINHLALPNGFPLQGIWNLAASGSGTIERLPSMSKSIPAILACSSDRSDRSPSLLL